MVMVYDPIMCVRDGLIKRLPLQARPGSTVRAACCQLSVVALLMNLVIPLVGRLVPWALYATIQPRWVPPCFYLGAVSFCIMSK